MNFTPFAFIQNPIVAVLPPPNPASSSQAFITAANITDPTQQTAITNLVVALYSSSLWDKMTALYPFVGGTATSHKYNLKDPRDSDDAYRIIFNGGWTHNSSGITGDGSTGYADTRAATNTTAIPDNKAHWSLYNKTLDNGRTTYTGVFDYPGPFTFFGYANNSFGRVGVGLQNFYYFNDSPGPPLPATTGFYNGSIITRNNGTIYKNGASIQSFSGLTNYSNQFNFYLGAMWFNGGASNFNNVTLALASLGNDLTATDAANYYTAVQAFQTTLGRQV